MSVREVGLVRSSGTRIQPGRVAEAVNDAVLNLVERAADRRVRWETLHVSATPCEVITNAVGSTVTSYNVTAAVEVDLPT